jgi:DNA invertase Pin-like site-specific DNA recombinase
MAERILAVAYYRMSNDKQETSIKDQRTAVEELARKSGYKIVREYRDEGISGDNTEKRAGFLRMLADVSGRGDFRAILCWDVDRFGRFDAIEGGYYVKPLRDAGVYMHTNGQGRIDWSDFAGRIVYSVTQEGKNAYLKDLSRNVTRGMLAKAKRGEWLGGKVPYGYRLNADTKRLEPGDPAEVETVRHLFREYLTRDVGLKTLARELDERGVPAPGLSRNDGGPAMWTVATVRNILTRPTYCGDTVWNRHPGGAYHGVNNGEVAVHTGAKRKQRRNPRAEWIVFENTHDAIVDRATFDRARRKLTTRQEGSSSPNPSAGFLFTGLLKCSRCGWPMHGQTQTTGGKSPRSYRRYVCGKYDRHRRRGCTSNHVQERDVLDVVLATLERAFLAPDKLSALRAEIERQERAERAGGQPATADLDKRIAALTAKIETGMERWLTAPPAFVKDAGAKLEQWRRELEELQDLRREVAKPAPTLPALDAVVAQITAGVTTLRKQAGKAWPDELRAVLRAMLDKVEIDFREEPYGQKRKRGVPVGGRMFLRDSGVVGTDSNRGACCSPSNSRASCREGTCRPCGGRRAAVQRR